MATFKRSMAPKWATACPTQYLSLMLHGACADATNRKLDEGPGDAHPPTIPEEGAEGDDDGGVASDVHALSAQGDDLDVDAWALSVLQNHQKDMAVAAEVAEYADDDTLFDEPEEDMGALDGAVDERKVFLTGRAAADDVDPADGLRRVVEEFGPWKGHGEEEFVQMLPMALYRSVLIKGVGALTNKRLVYLAFLPRTEAGKVLKTGMMNVHVKVKGRFYGSNHKTFRRWGELRTDSFLGYATSTNIYKPTASFSLHEIKSIDAIDPSRPKSLRINFANGNMCEMTLDTEEAAVDWHREMVGALFHFRARTDALRVAIPLARILSLETSVLEGIARVMRFNIDMVGCPMKCGHSIIEGEEIAETEIYLGYLLNHDPFAENLQTRIDLARAEVDCETARRLLPEPLLDIHGCEQLRKANAEAEAEAKPALPLKQDDPAQEDVDLPEIAKRFVKVLALDMNPKDLFVTRCQLIRTLPLYGTVAVGGKWFCFWRHNIFSADVKLRIPMSDIEGATTAKAFGFHVWGLAVQITGAPDVRLDFHSRPDRDSTLDAIRNALAKLRPAPEKALLGQTESNTSVSSLHSVASDDSEKTKAPDDEEGDHHHHHRHLLPLHLSHSHSRHGGSPKSGAATPAEHDDEGRKIRPLGLDIYEPVKFAPGAKLAHKIVAYSAGRKVMMPQRFVLLTIGSRGDVQVYISLGIRLKQDGHDVTIASHPEYRKWVESFGLKYKDVGGDPAALMKLAVEHPVLSTGFFKESIGHFRKWLDDLFVESWEACQGAEVLIESPSTFAGIHIAEKLQIPYFRAFTMPWTKTASYPQAMAAGNDIGPSYNLMSYSLFDNLIWTAMSGQVNRWRRKTLGLPPTTLERMHSSQTPFIYNFSSAVVPRPKDWKDQIFISGYWFLDTPIDFKPPEGLAEFIKKAKEDGVPIGYVGFGSITVPDAGAMTKAIYGAVKAAGIRAIVCKGWSERGSTKPVEEIPVPPEVLALDSIPHDWLFPQIDFACHHGGAGTTAASLRYGLPTLIHPFFGDQTFWTTRVVKLGAGCRVESLHEGDFTAAFKKATQDRIMKEKAMKIGKKIRSEDGPYAAIDFIHEHITLAKQRCVERAERTLAANSSVSSNSGTQSNKAPSSVSSPRRTGSSGSGGTDTPPSLARVTSSVTSTLVSRTATLPSLFSIGSKSSSVSSANEPRSPSQQYQTVLGSIPRRDSGAELKTSQSPSQTPPKLSDSPVNSPKQPPVVQS